MNEVNHHATLYYPSLSALLASLAPEIERAALALARRVFSVSLDPEDLKQEANTAILEASSRFDPLKIHSAFSERAWYMKRARGAMASYVRGLFDTQAVSLEAWQVVHAGDGMRERELPARDQGARLATLSERRRMLAALRSLTPIERAAILAAYGIEDERGRVASPGDVCARLHMTPGAYRAAKSRAIKRLALTL